MKTSEKKKSLKKKIYDLKRSISVTTDTEVLGAKEEELRRLKILKQLTLKNARAYQKYKNIRFFGKCYSERKKIERKISKVLKEIEAEGETIDLAAKKESLVEDLNYIKHYPLNKKYVSLFAEDSEDSIEARNVMKALVNDIIKKKQERKIQKIREEMESNTELRDAFFDEVKEKPRKPTKKQPRLPPTVEKPEVDTSSKFHMRF